MFSRLTNSMIYYGISYNTSDLSGDPYLNFVSAVTVELVAVICSYFIYERFGRKVPYTINMVLSGACLLSVLFIPKGTNL